MFDPKPLSTEHLLLRRTLDKATPADYVSWAVGQLVAGEDTPELRILAGLPTSTRQYDVERCFDHVADELSLHLPELPSDRRQRVRALYRLWELGALSARRLMTGVADIFRESDYTYAAASSWYFIESVVEEDLEREIVRDLYYADPVLHDLDETVRLEQLLFEEALSLSLPPDWHHYKFCPTCEHIGPAGVGPSTGSSFRYLVCERCKGNGADLRMMSHPTVRRRYFDSVKRNG